MPDIIKVIVNNPAVEVRASSGSVVQNSGVSGKQGRSAYESAVARGFVGTEVEWLASLQGEDGLPGEKGDTGDTGQQGIQGETGPQGIQGIQGETGLQGIQGEKGDTGDTGPQGIQGEAGSVIVNLDGGSPSSAPSFSGDIDGGGP